MFSIRRIITNKNISIYQRFVKFKTDDTKFARVQIDYINAMIQSEEINKVDWLKFKKDILNLPGACSDHNVNAVLLKALITAEKLEPALSLANHLKQDVNNLNLGSMNGILRLYFIIGSQRNITIEDKKFILDTYDYLYKKYKLLEYTTCESILLALCTIGEWKKALRVLENAYLSATPSHLVFSTLIGTLFKANKEKEAFQMIQTSLDNQRQLLEVAYDEWIKYIFRKYIFYKENKEDKETIIKYLDEINLHIKNNFVNISDKIAKLIKNSYERLKWKVVYSKINTITGHCACCNEKLDVLTPTAEEFQLLQDNIMSKLVVGSDLFIKSSPQELAKFQKYLKRNGPFDIVLDALNIAYASQNVTPAQRIFLLNSVTESFLETNKKVLVLGRKHMVNWNRSVMTKLLKRTPSFFTDDLSQDDPYLLMAAILSGPNTGIVSKDMLRCHKFKLDDIKLRQIFERWQWSNQWMVFYLRRGGFNIRKPLPFTPCAQKNGMKWHIPIENEEKDTDGDQSRNQYSGLPDNWLCIYENIESPVDKLN